MMYFIGNLAFLEYLFHQLKQLVYISVVIFKAL